MNTLEDINKEYIPASRIKSYITNLDIPAEAKVILTDLLKATVNVGGHLYRIGRKVVEIAITLALKFPTTTFLLIIASLITLLIAAVPLIGPVLAPIVGPLLAAAGLAIGAYKDIKNPELKDSIREITDEIGSLFPAAPETASA